MRAATLTTILLVMAAPVFGQAPRCLEPDHVSLRDDGPGRAILLYKNSADECSQPVNMILTTREGISVRVQIDPNEHTGKEVIRAIPQDPGFSAYPGRGEVRDGDQIEIEIVMGMS